MENTISRILFSVEPVAVFLLEDWDRAYEVLEEVGIQVLVYDPVRNVLRQDGKEISAGIGAVPTCPCVLVATRPSSEVPLNALQGAWGNAPRMCLLPASIRHRRTTRLPVTATAFVGALQIFRHILIAVLDDQTQTARQKVELIEEIVALRAELENHRSLLAEMTKASPDRLLKPQVSIDRSGEVMHPPGDNDGMLTFELPYDTWGIARLDLQFQDSVGEGLVEVALRTATNCWVLGEWKLAYSDITEDWQAFVLSPPFFQRDYGLNLTVAWSTKLKPAPALRMSDVVILPRGETFIDLNVEQLRLPALRLWRGLPDAAPTVES